MYERIDSSRGMVMGCRSGLEWDFPCQRRMPLRTYGRRTMLAMSESEPSRVAQYWIPYKYTRIALTPTLPQREVTKFSKTNSLSGRGGKFIKRQNWMYCLTPDRYVLIEFCAKDENRNLFLRESSVGQNCLRWSTPPLECWLVHGWRKGSFEGTCRPVNEKGCLN